MHEHIESYNVHDIIKFNLINKMRCGGILKGINTEYDYFKTNVLIDAPDFSINIYDYNSLFYKSKIKISKFIKSGDYYFHSDLDDEQKLIDTLRVRYNLKGIRNFIGYTTLKNIFVRSLLSLHLINRNCTLVHGGGVSHKGEASIFVGRPGVFKTTIVMNTRKKMCRAYFKF